MTVFDLISNWTESERNQLDDLIKECREREKFNRDTHLKNIRALYKLQDTLNVAWALWVIKVTRNQIKASA